MNRKELQRFAKILDYVLGVSPDEFGLVLDEDGFVTVKELFQALKEEHEWSFLRRGHLQQIMHSPARERFELQGDRIRSRSFQTALRLSPLDPPPALLYCAVRRRAHPVIIKRGLTPNKGPKVILAFKEEMALRMGRRRDPHPVLVKVQAREAALRGIRFLATAGGHLALTESVPPDLILCPPLPPEAPRASPSRPSWKPAGSFYPEPDQLIPAKPGASRDRKAWKRGKSRRRRRKGRDG